MRDFVKFILRELKPYKWTVIFCGFLAIIAALLDMTAPILMGRGFDAAAIGQPFLIFGGMLAAWFIIRLISERIRVYIGSRGSYLGDAISVNYMTRVMGELLNRPLSFHYGKKSNLTASRISQFRWNFMSVIEGIVFDFVPAVLAILAILTYLFIIEWRIGLVLFLGMIAFLLFTAWISRVWQKKRDANNEVGRKIEQVGWDSLRNVLVVKSTSNEGFFERSLAKFKKHWLKSNTEVIAFEKRNTHIQNTIIAISSFGAVMLGVYDLSIKIFTIGQLSAVVAYCFAIFGYVRYIQWQIRWFLRSMVDYSALQKVLIAPPENFISGKSLELLGGVHFEHVAFGYQKDRQILRDVSFSVNPGERVAVVGESGQGKTTLVDLLGHYYDADGGKIVFDGVDIGDINLKSLRSQMAYVPQDLTLFHETLEFNIRYGRPEANDREIKRAAEEAHLTEFIKKLPKGMKTVVGERGLKLSGGERQRVALARAFLRNPKILVLDEPTAHLDSRTENYIQDALHDLMRGRTTFIIAHRLRTVQNADKILVLKDGRIVEVGRHEELIKKPDSVYTTLLKAQGGYISPDEPHLK